MDVEVRPYQPSDLPAVTRMWREIRWIDESERMAEALAVFLDGADALVGLLDGEAEALVHRTPGVIRYDDRDLPLAAVTAVTTSVIGRNLGLATRITGASLAEAALDGAAVAALGMFEQGFYDRLGFGSYPYSIQLDVDPADLQVPVPSATPVRLGREDWPDVADLLARRRRSHGEVRLDRPQVVQAELSWFEDPFLAFGFRDGDGRLRACLAGTCAGESGPYRVGLLAYVDDGDLLDLFGLLRSLSAQIARVLLVEPARVQVQDLLARPIRGHDLLEPERRSPHAAMAWYQLRILDLEACVAARSWPGEEVAFDLVLRDPLSERGLPWPGLSGEWSVRVGEASTAERGHRGGLPILEASVNAFSRLWFGARPASGLAVTTDLSGPPELLAALDRALLLPPPLPGLAF